MLKIPAKALSSKKCKKPAAINDQCGGKIKAGIPIIYSRLIGLKITMTHLAKQKFCSKTLQKIHDFT